MADFLSRLAARTLGVAPTVQPSIASMFAQGPTLAGNYPLESWPESESPGDSVPQAGFFVQKIAPAFSYSISPSPSLVPQNDLSSALPAQFLSSSEGASASTRATYSQPAMFDVAPLERTDSLPSLPISRRNNLVTSMSIAHPRFREDVVSMHPDRPPTYPVREDVVSMHLDRPPTYSVYSMERSSFQDERRVARDHVGTLGARPVGTVHPGNDRTPLSRANVPYESDAGYPQRTPLQDGGYSSLRHTGFTNGMNETIVEQEQGTKTQFAPSLHVQAVHDGGEQLIVISHPDVSETRSSATLPQRSIAPKVMRPIANSGLGAEAQVIEVPAPAPTIQVTIGRIEVRAMPPPPAQPQSQQRPAPSIMSLDQYLQQRSKGGDR